MSTEAQRAAARSFYARNRDKVKAQVTAYRKRYPLMRAKHRNGMVDVPPPPPLNCEACGRTFGDTRSTKGHVDHDHATGKFRGWLCTQCNMALGLLGDAPAGVGKLLTYISSRE